MRTANVLIQLICETNQKITIRKLKIRYYRRKQSKKNSQMLKKLRFNAKKIKLKS